MKKFISLGTKCVEFLKAARASQGKFFAKLCLLSISFVFLRFFIRLSFSLFPAADALLMANARIASLEAELEASQKAWDVATAAKAAAEKSATGAATKVKKAEKALADANQWRIQIEEAITKRLNQVSALASGKYLSALSLVYLLILRLTDVH
jgi:uncharacterized protein YlxW (UPF0749 family)